MGVRKVIRHLSLIPLLLVPWVVSLKGQLPRTRLSGPSVGILSPFFRTTQNFPPLNQPLPVGLVDAAASGSVPAFPAGSLDWLVAFLQQIMSPEDYQKYKSSFEPVPAKEEPPAGGAIGQTRPRKGARSWAELSTIENVCRDLETKLMKQSELLDEAVERRATLQNEIHEP